MPPCPRRVSTQSDNHKSSTQCSPKFYFSVLRLAFERIENLDACFNRLAGLEILTVEDPTFGFDRRSEDRRIIDGVAMLYSDAYGRFMSG